MVARGGIEPPTRGFSGCGLILRLTGQVYDAEIIQGVLRKQEDVGGSPRKLGTGALVQNLVQTTLVSPRQPDKTCSLYLRSYRRDLVRTVDEKIDQHDVAKYLGVSTKTVRALVERGELPPPIRIGRKQFWLKDKFTRWLQDGGAASVQGRSAATSLKLCAPRGRPRVGC